MIILYQGKGGYSIYSYCLLWRNRLVKHLRSIRLRSVIFSLGNWIDESVSPSIHKLSALCLTIFIHSYHPLFGSACKISPHLGQVSVRLDDVDGYTFPDSRYWFAA